MTVASPNIESIHLQSCINLRDTSPTLERNVKCTFLLNVYLLPPNHTRRSHTHATNTHMFKSSLAKKKKKKKNKPRRANFFFIHGAHYIGSNRMEKP